MKSFYARGVMFAWGLLSLSQITTAVEPFGSAALLPIPTQNSSEETVARTAYSRRGFQEDIPSPSDLAPSIAPEVYANPAPQLVSPAQGYTQSPAPLSKDYQNAMNNSWADGTSCNSGSCGDSSCGSSCGGSCGISNRWFASAGGLIMNRSNQSHHSLSQDINTYNTILNTQSAAQQTAGGFEGSMGRLIGCNGCNALQLGYWGLFPSDQSAQKVGSGYPPAGIGPIFGHGLNFLDYNDGTTNQNMQQWMTTDTGVHQVRRSFNYNSAEANFLGNSYAWGLLPYSANCGCGPRLQYGWLAGFRYFQFSDTTTFYSDYDDTTIDGDANEFRYKLNTKNNLYGFQMGGQANWRLNNCWSIYGGGRAGVFNNHITHQQFISGQLDYATINAGAYAGQAYNINASRNALAGIGQLDMGLRYNVNCRLSFNGGYRVVGIAGLATSDNQISDNFADPRQAAYIRADSSVILHGGYFGGTFLW